MKSYKYSIEIFDNNGDSTFEQGCFIIEEDNYDPVGTLNLILRSRLSKPKDYKIISLTKRDGDIQGDE